MKNTSINDFENNIEKYFNSSAFLFAKGRVGLYAILRTLGIGDGDEILLPGYTCLVVPTAAVKLGINPIYVDIDPKTYNINENLIQSKITSRTKCIIVQHTYGIPCNMNRIVELASENNIPIIEDCCLAFGSTYNKKLCGTFGIASYFSGQWNKPFTTGLGGMLIVNETSMVDKLQKLVDDEMIQPSLSYRIRIWLQIMLFEYMVNPESVQTITCFYRKLSNFGVMIGSSCFEEYDGKVPSNYFMGMTPEQARRGLYEMSRIDANIKHRKKIEVYYNIQLPKAGFKNVDLNDELNPAFVRYPVRVKNKSEILDMAYKERIEIGSWFESPLHPEGTNLGKFGYEQGLCPEAEKAAREVINLPTNLKTTLDDATRVIEFLKKYAIQQ